jgi:hypothetical protein
MRRPAVQPDFKQLIVRMGLDGGGRGREEAGIGDFAHFSPFSVIGAVKAR